MDATIEAPAGVTFGSSEDANLYRDPAATAIPLACGLLCTVVKRAGGRLTIPAAEDYTLTVDGPDDNGLYTLATKKVNE